MTRITTNGPNHYDPRPMTSWQKDHRDGPLCTVEVKGEHWAWSLLLWTALALVGIACAVAFT